MLGWRPTNCKHGKGVADDRSDKELLDAWGAGDQGAGDILVRRHFDVVYRFFASRHVEPSDLIQRTFLACVESRGRFDHVVSFRAFLLGIARHQLLRDIRSEGRHRRAVQRKASEDDFLASIGGQVALREEMRLLLRALRTLPLELQLALQLYYWEDLGTAEIGEVLEIPRGTVMSRLHRARQLLREAIAELAESEELGDATVRDLEKWARSVRGLLDQLVSHHADSE